MSSEKKSQETEMICNKNQSTTPRANTGPPSSLCCQITSFDHICNKKKKENECKLKEIEYIQLC